MPRCQGAADGRHDVPVLQYSTEIADNQRVFSENLKVLEWNGATVRGSVRPGIANIPCGAAGGSHSHRGCEGEGAGGVARSEVAEGLDRPNKKRPTLGADNHRQEERRTRQPFVGRADRRMSVIRVVSGF